jgi:LCP family protein required for cell wall assembly
VRRGGAVGIASYSVMCLLAALVLVASGVSSYFVHDVSSIGGSNAIKSGPSIGAQNILLMGLESRTSWNGNILPGSILKHLHAGSYRGIKYQGVGGNDTNTLILIHIFAGGKRAVGFSIPRDDLVNFSDTLGPQQQGKIDQAYGISMYYKEGAVRSKNPHMSAARVAFIGNEAGRAAAVHTVEELTGVHIDHFAEVNLGGFYELAKVFGGVEVCLNHAVSDSYSGAHFHKGYQHLTPTQSLAFVRQRHGLVNGDLDRTHRQQAFIDSIIYQLRTEGVLSDLTKLNALLNVAKQYVITDSHWNLLDFASEVKGLTGRDLTFHTLPIKGYGTWGNPPQDVNLVNPTRIKQIVHAAFYAPPAPKKSKHGQHSPTPGGSSSPAPKAIVDVLNGTSTPLLAAHVSAALAKAGYPTGTPGNTASPQATTEVLYGSGATASGIAIAKLFGVTAAASQSVKAGHVKVLLGSGATVPNVTAGVTTGRSKSPAAIPTKGAQGGAVVPGKKYGIPCVN